MVKNRYKAIQLFIILMPIHLDLPLVLREISLVLSSVIISKEE